ncbi:uncharacterized protein LOC129759952 [Uranotaenia lowii]|uniref:uncharacterized protein LOC129759952 n=1 Tax=Uranotaenia lowii TaxID=190385 RepID=UPI00247AF1D5|nr:uncharacterized protein LOC129759952 [Uranotaenia lowii]
MRIAINTPEDSTVNEQFIKLVQETPILWNLHLACYRNKELKHQKWAEIGAAFNISAQEAYKKFVALREKYKREQKLRETKSICEAESWRLYEKLKFLDTVSFSRDRRWAKPKTLFKRHNDLLMAMVKQDLASTIKVEYPDLHNQSNLHSSISSPTSPSYQLSGDPSENESSEAHFNESSDCFPDSNNTPSNRDAGSETAPDDVERIESYPDDHRQMEASGSSAFVHEPLYNNHQNRQDSKFIPMLQDFDRRKQSWSRCETLGQRIAQTMYALEENDPDLALKFDIILSEAITSIKKDQLQRLVNRQQQGQS